MKRLLALLCLSTAMLFAQNYEPVTGSPDRVSTAVCHVGDAGCPPMDFSTHLRESILGAFDRLVHPYHIEARHADGTLFYVYNGHNIRTTAGTNWESQLLSDTSSPSVNSQCNYVALTNSAITPAEADTTLSGQLDNTNGLGPQQATYANISTTLAVPSAPTVTVKGTAGSTTLYYWVFACNQGICTTISASGTTSTSQATASLSDVLYNQISWTPVVGASSYVVLRTTSSSAPTGTQTEEVGNTAYCSATTCKQNDTGVALVSFIIPSSNLTNFGGNTLVYTWTAGAAVSAQAFGVFTGAGGTGTMCFEGTFTQVSLNNNDTFKITETIYF